MDNETRIDDETLARRIRAILGDGLQLDDACADITTDAPLVSSGIIDSYGLQELGSIFEREFGITVTDRDLHGGGFESIDDMIRLIRKAKSTEFL